MELDPQRQFVLVRNFSEAGCKEKLQLAFQISLLFKCQDGKGGIAVEIEADCAEGFQVYGLEPNQAAAENQGKVQCIVSHWAMPYWIAIANAETADLDRAYDALQYQYIERLEAAEMCIYF